LNLIDDAGLVTIAQMIYENVGTDNEFGFAQLIDALPTEDLKAKIASWAFSQETAPKKEEFLLRLKELKANYLYRELLKAKQANQTTQFERITNEYYEVKRQISLMRQITQNRGS